MTPMNPATPEGPYADALDAWNKCKKAITDSIEHLGVGIAAHGHDLDHLHKLVADLQFRMDHLEGKCVECRRNLTAPGSLRCLQCISAIEYKRRQEE